MKEKYNILFFIVIPSLQKDDQINKDSKGAVSKPIEENLSADFKKKLQEWRIKVTTDFNSL